MNQPKPENRKPDFNKLEKLAGEIKELTAKEAASPTSTEVRCKENCLNHKLHCADCWAPITYSPANYASRPNDIPNPCPNGCGRIPPASTEEWRDVRKNLKAMIEKYPATTMDCIDAAYLHGLETITSHDQQLRQRIDGLRSEGISLEDNRECIRISKTKNTEIVKLHNAMHYKITEMNHKLADLITNLK